MQRFLIRFTVIALLFASVLGLGAGVANAGGNGAQTGGDQIKVNDCYDTGYGTTFCYTAKGEYHFVATRTGGYNGQLNIQSECYTETDNVTGDVLYHTCYTNEHNLYHFNGTDTQVLRSVFTVSYTDSFGNAYCYTAQYHEANGQVQFDRLVPC